MALMGRRTVRGSPRTIQSGHNGWGSEVGGVNAGVEGYPEIGTKLANGRPLLPSKIRLLISLMRTYVKQQKRRTGKKDRTIQAEITIR